MTRAMHTDSPNQGASSHSQIGWAGARSPRVGSAHHQQTRAGKAVIAAQARLAKTPRRQKAVPVAFRHT